MTSTNKYEDLEKKNIKFELEQAIMCKQFSLTHIKLKPRVKGVEEIEIGGSAPRVNKYDKLLL